MFKDLKQDAFLYFVVLSSMALAISNYFLPLSVDVSLHFFHAIRFLENGGLYTRWVEVMPPTIYMLYIIPAYLHKLTTLSYVFCLNFFVDILSFASLFLISASLKASHIEDSLKKNLFIASIIIFFVLPVFTLSCNDREALFLILCFPWIINKILKTKSNIYIIIFAAIGFSIKQYSYLYPGLFILLIESFDKSYFRKVFSKENLQLAAAVAILNLTFIIKFTAYYTELLPILLVAYKGYYTYAYAVLVGSALMFSAMIYFFAKIPSLQIYKKAYCIFFIISILEIILNGNVRYNYNYVLSLAILAFFHIISSCQKKQTVSTLNLFINMGITLTLIFQAIFIYFILTYKEPKEVSSCHEKINQYTKRPYIFLSVGSWAYEKNYADPLGNENHMFAIDHLWMLPWLYNNLADPKAAAVKSYIRNKFMEALQREKNISILAIVSGLHKAMPEDFNIMDFMRNELHLSEELKGFKNIGVIQECTAATGEKIQVWQKQ